MKGFAIKGEKIQTYMCEKCFGRCASHYICHTNNIAFQKRNMIPTVKYCGGNVTFWSCVAASETKRLEVVNGAMNSAIYYKFLKENVRPSVRDLMLKCTSCSVAGQWSKYTSKSASEWLKKNELKTCSGLVKVLTWIQLRCCGLNIKMWFTLKTLQCGWITIILQGWAGQNSSTVR